MRYAVFLVLSSLVICSAQSRENSAFANLKPGPHAVGFRVVQQYDYTRSFRGKTDIVTGKPTTGERARPMQTLVWYPAKKSGRPIRYRDYIETEATDEVFEQSAQQRAAFVAHRAAAITAALGEERARAAIAQPMWALRDATPGAGKFPVVIYAPGGGGTAHENADMFEYLASHGYIVLATRNMGTRTRAINIDVHGIDSQMRDIQFLVSYAHTLPQADTAHIAAAGWSWGGMTNVFAAARDNRISALVSLDGTREPGFTKAIGQTEVTVPWLYISRRPQTIPELNKQGIETSFSLLNELKYADIYQLIMHPMEHNDFASSTYRYVGPDYYQEYSRPEVETAYYWTARYVLEFLDGHLKGDRAALEFLQAPPRKHGVPAHTMTVQRSKADGLPPGRAAFAAELSRRGFEQALPVYKDMRKRAPAFELSWRDVNDWGYVLMRRENDAPAAVEMFRFGTMLYPDNAELFDSLGEAHENNQQPGLAIQNYRRTLELNPGHSHAGARLKILAPAVTARSN